MIGLIAGFAPSSPIVGVVLYCFCLVAFEVAGRFVSWLNRWTVRRWSVFGYCLGRLCSAGGQCPAIDVTIWFPVTYSRRSWSSIVGPPWVPGSVIRLLRLLCPFAVHSPSIVSNWTRLPPWSPRTQPGFPYDTTRRQLAFESGRSESTLNCLLSDSWVWAVGGRLVGGLENLS